MNFFQRARRLVIAQFQRIVYGDFLPILIGKEAVAKYHLNTSFPSRYNPTSDPSMKNEFSAAAFRFPHTMVNHNVSMKK